MKYIDPGTRGMFVISCETGRTLRVVCLMRVEFVVHHKMKVRDGSGCRVRMCLATGLCTQSVKISIVCLLDYSKNLVQRGVEVKTHFHKGFGTCSTTN